MLNNQKPMSRASVVETSPISSFVFISSKSKGK